MRNNTIDGFLHALADRMPAPGGGASAGLHAAQAAALVAMVARYTEGSRFVEHPELVRRVRDTADRLRDEALTRAEDDVAAFTAVTTARGNIEINLGGISRIVARAGLRATANSVDGLADRAEQLTATVRTELGR